MLIESPGRTTPTLFTVIVIFQQLQDSHSVDIRICRHRYRLHDNFRASLLFIDKRLKHSDVCTYSPLNWSRFTVNVA